jgi:hypothetical protein
MQTCDLHKVNFEQVFDI